MRKLTVNDLLSLERYHDQRNVFRAQLKTHKAERRLAVGEHANLYFEDQFTMQYQVQEMLYIEKIFAKAEIQQELDTYNPLIPEGNNWKATLMLEYADVAERKKALEKLVGVEDKFYVEVNGFAKVYAIADEDLPGKNPNKTSAVHFLRFQFSNQMVDALKNDTPFSIGVEHPNYSYVIKQFPKELIEQLLGDLD